MEFFLDTANLQDIRKFSEWGIITGVTTNPSLIAKEGKDFKETIREIASIIEGDISAEVLATDSAQMVEEGIKLSKIHKRIVVKIPITTEGIKAIRALSAKGIKVNTTLIFSGTQALIAAKAGAYYVSPFIGRLDDIGENGMQLIKDIRQIFDNYGIKTKILAASIRNAGHVLECAKAGADVVTVPASLMDQLAKHKLTDTGLQKFLDDAKKSNVKV